MTQTHASRRQRKGFTLIELLVVIAIIAVLLGMLLVAIMPMFNKGPEVTARKDISLLSTKVAEFQSDRTVGYLPSRLLLKEDGNYGAGVAAQDMSLARESSIYLKKIFPGLIGPQDWNGDSGIDGPTKYYILDGSQCMVFLLGGINGLKGFSTNTRNPAAVANRMDLIGPFYKFEPTRLIDDPLTPGFPRYIDPWGQKPYAYFSSYGKQNGYNRYASSDCPSLGLVPYCSAVDASGNPLQYYNPDSFQIITAGKDGVFGPGGLWGPNANIPDATRDDMSNFGSGKLGSP